ncbi:MAG: homoserine dehydrogenase [Actinomycetes bacterium]
MGLCLLGFGNVGRRFTQILVDRADQLADVHGVRFAVHAVGTRSHGSLLAPEGVDPAELLRRSDGPASFRLPDPARTGIELIERSQAEVLVEATVAEGTGAPVATKHVETALAHSMDVVTVNKGPIAWHFRRLADLAAAQGRQLRYEGVTMDGVPVYNVAEFCLPGATITGFRGVLNATSNYVLERLADGISMEQAVAQAQVEGFAEADPHHDLAGHDGAAKVAALANVLLDARITPDDVPRCSIEAVTAEQVASVRGRGLRLRVVCQARSTGGLVTAGMDLAEVSPDDPLFAVGATASMVALTTDLAGTVEITQRGGGLTATAYAVLSDLLTLYGRRRGGDTRR